MPIRSALCCAGTAAGLGALLMLAPATADAHVRVSADSTTPGSFSALTFRVPNESDTAGTVGLTVQLPQDTPFLYVSSKPVPGWRVSTVEAPLPKPVVSYGTTLTKAVRTVTWTAEKGTEIRPGEYQEFSLSVGPLPTAPGTVLLPADQTYSDGTVVKWDQPTPAGGEEPEHPAPQLVVAAGGSSQTSSMPSMGTAPAAPTAAAVVRQDVLARGLGGVGLALGAAALVVALVTARRRSARSSV